MTQFQYTTTDTAGKVVFFGERAGAYAVAAAGSFLTVRAVQADEVDALRAKIKDAASAANNAWLADMDNDAKYADMLATSSVVDAFEAVHGKEVIRLSEERVAEMMDRSVFGAADRKRAALKTEQEAAGGYAAHVRLVHDEVEVSAAGVHESVEQAVNKVRADAWRKLEDERDQLLEERDTLRAELLELRNQVAQ